MSRLTKRNNKGYVGIKGYHGLLTSYCYECTEELEDGVYLLEDALNKLAEYEDLEEQELLLRLPCKVGDTVYINLPSWAGKFAGTQPHQITNILISQNKKGKWTKKYRAMLLYNGKTIDRQENFEFDEIGKTVFLTREEAEAKLKEMGENV